MSANKDIKASREKELDSEKRHERKRKEKKRSREIRKHKNKELRVSLERYFPNINPEDNERNKISSPEKKTPSSDHKSNLETLQEGRGSELWIKCSNKLCKRWWLLDKQADPTNFPKKFLCCMLNDKNGVPRKCSDSINNRSPSDLKKFIYIEYTAGSLVLAKLEGYPWWPAMVDDCPDVMSFYWLKGNSRIPSDYNVTFLDSASKHTTRAWIGREDLRPLPKTRQEFNRIVNIGLYWEHKDRIEDAWKIAKEAEKYLIKRRLKEFSFLARYKGPINSPQKANNRNSENSEITFESNTELYLTEIFALHQGTP